MIWIAAAIFVVVSAAAWALDWMSFHQGISRPEVFLLDDVLTGGLSAALVVVVMRRAAEKQCDLERRLKLQGDMNHHIRNALQPILYAYTITPNEYTPMVRESVQRIEWALREVLQDPHAAASDPTAYSDKIDKIHSPE